MYAGIRSLFGSWPISLADAIAEHGFGALFTGHLGWERGTVSYAFTTRGRSWLAEVVAHTNGLQVCWCRTDRRTLLDRYLIRDIHARLTKLVRENILILSCDDPRKQAWAWAIRTADGDTLRHREPPFFSAKPPALLVDRLRRLEFTPAADETAGPPDAGRRVRAALDARPAVELFVKTPASAVKSDALERPRVAPDPAAVHRLVLRHRPLARAGAKWLARWFGLPPEDGEQIGLIGLVQAALEFDPARGVPFATSARWWIRQACQRHGPAAALPIRLPTYVLWPCVRHSFALTAARTAGGPAAVVRAHARFAAADTTLARRWPFYVQARRTESLAERGTWRRAVTRPDDIPAPGADLSRDQVAARVRAAVGRLHPRYADVIRRRFGLDCEEETLIEIGTAAGLTRERIRQLEAKGLVRLRDWLSDLVPDWWTEAAAVVADEPD